MTPSLSTVFDTDTCLVPDVIQAQLINRDTVTISDKRLNTL